MPFGIGLKHCYTTNRKISVEFRVRFKNNTIRLRLLDLILEFYELHSDFSFMLFSNLPTLEITNRIEILRQITKV